ncbi:MAG: response regulator transcription factor [Proteobacteria bacterium]|nr:MAG: response regulator transcription factor [Pseudomonadota bacterium]
MQRADKTKPTLSKVVICDDHVISQLGIQCLLEDRQPPGTLQVWKANSAAEAIRLVREHSPDLLTLDLHLPGMDGLEALKRLRETDSSTRVMIVTVESRVPLLSQLLRYRVSAILLKSHSREVFEEAVRRIETQTTDSTYIDPSLEQRMKLEAGNARLSAREFDVVQLLLAGHTNKSIAAILKFSPETVKTLRARIMKKINATNRAEIAKWFQRGSVN